MKGRNSGVIGIRLPDEIIAGIRSYLRDGQTVSSWVKDLVISSVNTRDSGTKTGAQSQTSSVNTTPKIAELQKMIHHIEQKPVQPAEFIPWYNPLKHKTGDKVRMRDATGRVQVGTVPEVDAEGNPLW